MLSFCFNSLKSRSNSYFEFSFEFRKKVFTRPFLELIKNSSTVNDILLRFKLSSNLFFEILTCVLIGKSEGLRFDTKTSLSPAEPSVKVTCSQEFLAASL